MESYDFSSLLEDGRYKDRRTVLAIGVFDGVHLGHASILSALKKKAESEGALSAVISFSVNPKGKEIAQIDTLRLRREYAALFGIDLFVVIDFSRDFSKITSRGFISLLGKAFAPVSVVVGTDFRFGNPSEQAEGKDMPLLFSEIGIDCGVTVVKPVLDSSGRKISSTYLRQLINSGELGTFHELSGQFYRVDLSMLEIRSGSQGLTICRTSIHQLLPPAGTYEGLVLLSDGRQARCALTLDEDHLVLSDSSLLPDGGTGEVTGKLRLDSIFLVRKKDDHKRTESRGSAQVRQ